MRRLAFLAATIGIFLLPVPATGQIAPPANDNFADAQLLTGSAGTVTGTHEGASMEADEPPFHVNYESVWYGWTAPASGTVTLDTIGGLTTACCTEFRVYAGTALPDLSMLATASLDPRFDYASKAAFTAVEGHTYYFMLGASTRGQGAFRLNWRLAPGLSTSANDDFGQAQQLSGQQGKVGGTTVGASLERHEPVTADCSDSVWYRWTPQASGTAFLSDYWATPGLCVDVFTGSAVSDLTPVQYVASGLDTDDVGMARLNFHATAGTTYRIKVSAWGAGPIEGPFTLNWALEAAASSANDSLASPLALTGSAGSVTGTTVGATKQLGEEKVFHGGNNGWRSVWFRWQSPGPGKLTLDTQGSAHDTLLSAYADDDMTFLKANRIDWNDNARADLTSRLSFQTYGSGPIWIALDAYAEDGGPYTLAWDFIADDITPPETILDSGPPESTKSRSATFSFHSPEAGVTFTCWLDDHPAFACVSPETLSNLTDGRHTFTVAARDSAGNVDPTPASLVWHVDNTGPNVVLSGPSEPDSSVAATFAFEADEPVSGFECMLDARPSIPCASPTTLRDLTAGSHTLHVWGIDLLGNVTPDPGEITWVVGVRLASGALLLTGTPGPDVIQGTAGPDVLRGYGGADVLRGAGGKDVLNGGEGNDRFYARDAHRDDIRGGPGFDRARLDRLLDRRTSIERLF